MPRFDVCDKIPALPAMPAETTRPPVSGKIIRQNINGLFLLDKPCGMTSNAALQKVKWLFCAKKAGHTGTLDPMASGLLPLCFGEATKFSADLLEADKTYEAELFLGRTTDTGDKEGRVTGQCPVLSSLSDIESALKRFTGQLLQVPPMYSALKREGRPLYELARQGVTVERAPRPVTIRLLELLAWEAPRLVLRVCCSKGTYIRTLADDLGKDLGCGAHLTALRRTKIGTLDIAKAHALFELETLDAAKRHSLLMPLDHLLFSLPIILLDPAEKNRFTHGNPVSLAESLPGQTSPLTAKIFRVYEKTDESPAPLLGLGEVRADCKLWPRRLIATQP